MQATELYSQLTEIHQQRCPVSRQSAEHLPRLQPRVSRETRGLDMDFPRPLTQANAIHFCARARCPVPSLTAVAAFP